MPTQITVLGTCHFIQGCEHSSVRIEDPDYAKVLKVVVESEKLDFIFEEAAETGSTIAKTLASDFRLRGYRDVDPGREERRALGIPEETGESWPVDPVGDCRESLHWQAVEAHAMREELWARRIVECQFASGLLICGISHSLSMAFRLEKLGFTVKVAVYEPHCKICDGLRRIGLA